jgi:hypothetical protein
MDQFNNRLTSAEIAALRRYLDARGHRLGCAAIGVVRTTAYKALAGFPVQRGTAALIRAALGRLKSPSPEVL